MAGVTSKSRVPYSETRAHELDQGLHVSYTCIGAMLLNKELSLKVFIAAEFAHWPWNCPLHQRAYVVGIRENGQ